ncbi:MAG: DUF4138 domain-containing protein [Bacteroidota bacterium]
MRKKTLKKLSSLWILWLVPLSAHSEGPMMPDELLASHRYITVLVFDSPVCEVDLSSNAYVAKISGNYLLLRCRQRDALPTSLFATYNEGRSFLHTLIRYAPDPPKTYDLRALDPSASDKQGAGLLQRVGYLSALPQAYKDVGLRADGLTLVLMNAMTDKEHIYLRLSLQNESGMDYTIESVRCAFQSGEKKEIEVRPVFAEEPGVEAGHREILVYVLPRYGMKVKGSLQLELREANGERTLQLDIPGTVLTKAHRHKDS